MPSLKHQGEADHRALSAFKQTQPDLCSFDHCPGQVSSDLFSSAGAILSSLMDPFVDLQGRAICPYPFVPNLLEAMGCRPYPLPGTRDRPALLPGPTLSGPTLSLGRVAQLARAPRFSLGSTIEKPPGRPAHCLDAAPSPGRAAQLVPTLCLARGPYHLPGAWLSSPWRVAPTLRSPRRRS